MSVQYTSRILQALVIPFHAKTGIPAAAIAAAA
jgi:hypothetical protein